MGSQYQTTAANSRLELKPLRDKTPRTGVLNTNALSLTIAEDPGITGAGVGWRNVHVDSHRANSLEVASQNPHEVIFTQIPLTGTFLSETHDGHRIHSSSIGLSRVLNKGAIVHLTEGHLHQFGIHVPLDVVGNWFDGQLPDGLRPFLRDQVVNSQHQQLQIPAALQTALRTALAQSGPLNRLAVEGISLQIMTFMLQNASQDLILERASQQWQIRGALEAMEILRSSVENPPSVAKLAVMVGLSTHRLEQSFQEAHGITLYQAIVELRFQAACDALRAGETIKSVAFRFGYANASNFTYAFRRRLGMPPRAWLNATAKPSRG